MTRTRDAVALHRAWAWCSPTMPPEMCGAPSLSTAGEIAFDLADVERRHLERQHAEWEALQADLVALNAQRHELLKRALAKQLEMADVAIAMSVIDDETIVLNTEWTRYL